MAAGNGSLSFCFVFCPILSDGYFRDMIRFGFDSSSVVLSSDMPDIHIFTDHDFVEFRFLAGEVPLLEGRYYAFNGEAVISDLASLTELFLSGSADSNFFVFTIEAFFGDDKTDFVSLDLPVLYCDKAFGAIDPSAWLRENFLTLSPLRRIAPDSFINVSWYASQRESVAFDIYATFLDDKEQRGTYHYRYAGNGQMANVEGIYQHSIFLSEIRDKVLQAKSLDAITLQAVTVRCGNRSATFFIDPELSLFRPFYYLNCFGVVEHISLECTTKEKTKTDSSLVSLGRTSSQYDISISKDYEVESAPITSDECVQLEQLVTSSSVRIPHGTEENWYESDFDVLNKILITDYTAEFNNSDDKLNSVKFTWRFKDNRPKVVPPSMPGIFNDSFNPAFS